MALKFYESTDMTNIANAIRSKNGSSNTYLVSEMASAINDLDVGGDAEAIINGTITNLYSEATSVRYYFMYNYARIQKVELPNARTIGERAFGGCSNLKTVILGSVTRIDSRAFSYATKLDDLVLDVDAIPTLASYTAFEYTPIAQLTGYIYITDSLVDQLKAAANWSTYATQIKPLSERSA